MDPFSLTVSIISLVALAGQTLTCAKTYYSGAKHARESAVALVLELEALQSNLSHLDQFLRSESTKGLAFSQTSTLGSSASALTTKLTALCAKLGRVGESRTQRLLWPLNEADHVKTIKALRAFTQTIQFGLSIDGCALLSRTSADVVRVLQQQIDMMRIVEDCTAELREAVVDQTSILQKNQEAKLREDVLSWISTSDYLRKHHTVRLPRVDGTGGWLLQHPKYVAWRDDESSSNVLWCHGIQGSGKSILTSLVVDQLRNSFAGPDHPLAFVYFDYRKQKDESPIHVLASILKQIVASLPTLPDAVMESFGKSEDAEQQLSSREFEKMILSVAGSVKSVYLVIDALDECDEQKHRRSFLQILERFKMDKHIRFFVTSRSYPQDIRAALEAGPQIEIKARDADLRRYLLHELKDVCDSGVIGHGFAMEIVGRLIDGAQGLFLLAVLQLRTILNEPNAGDMEDVLAHLSHDLPEAFEETIARIQHLPEGRKGLGIKTLLWVSHSTRLLTVSELVEALSIKPGQSAPNRKYQPSPKLVLECCQGLINIDPESMFVRPAHYSIQEYLVRHSDTIFPRAQAEIATTCLTYLLFDEFQAGPCHGERSMHPRMEAHPLLFYAAYSGCTHSKNAGLDPTTRDITNKFLNSPGALASANQAIRYGMNYREEYWSHEESSSLTPLHFASWFGLRDIVCRYLECETVAINIRSKMGTTPLILAASKGHAEIVKMLMERGADPNLANWYGNALHCAAESGECGAILALIQHGMDPNTRTNFSRTALHCTTDNDHTKAAETLIANGADVDARDQWGYTILHQAVDGNALETVDLLLAKSLIDVDVRETVGNGTALHIAARCGDSLLIHKLLRAGADPNARNLAGETPYDLAPQILESFRANGFDGSCLECGETITYANSAKSELEETS